MDLILLLALGSLLILVMFGWMLRKHAPAVALVPEGLRMGPDTIVAWDGVVALDYRRRQSRARFAVHSGQGRLDFTNEQAGEPDPERLKNAIVAAAGLSAAAEKRLPGEIVERWHREVEVVEPEEPRRGGRGVKAALGAAGILGLLLLKLKKIAFLVLVGLQWGVKALKLAKFGPTVISMFVTIGVYALLWGWLFAVGFVVLIYLHEMGHWAVIRAKGLKAGVPIFIPFVGALIALRGQMADATVEAEMAYGGPAAGALASTGCFALWLATGSSLWLALAYVGFFMNLFNLVPIAPLDGGRIVTAISTKLWIAGIVAAGLLFFYTFNVILLLIVFLGIGRAWSLMRGKERQAPGYYAMAPSYRLFMGTAYFGLAGYLGFLAYHAHEILKALQGRA
ncbi:MAG: site-2 protease family protein [Planctomycetes bacterium]|nr:site-2 protease family protein [Planctomycetota bacterium]